MSAPGVLTLKDVLETPHAKTFSLTAKPTNALDALCRGNRLYHVGQLVWPNGCDPIQIATEMGHAVVDNICVLPEPLCVMDMNKPNEFWGTTCKHTSAPSEPPEEEGFTVLEGPVVTETIQCDVDGPFDPVQVASLCEWKHTCIGIVRSACRVIGKYRKDHPGGVGWQLSPNQLVTVTVVFIKVTDGVVHIVEQ